MVVHNTPIANLKVFYKLIFAVFLPPYSDITCVHTMQFLVVFDRSEVRPKVVLAARWRRRAHLMSPIDSQTTVPHKCFFDINRLSLSVSVF
jgi:hypothetical protein